MAKDNKIMHFTAADIERYHQGLLSNKEMHDLEKAAMDDPFLADALEGYALPGINAKKDIEELKKRIEEKSERTKVVPLRSASGSNRNLLRAAVVIAFVAGAGLLIYQFGFNKKTQPLAETRPVSVEKPRSTNSSIHTNNNSAPTGSSTTGSANQATSPETGGSVATLTEKNEDRKQRVKEGSDAPIDNARQRRADEEKINRGSSTEPVVVASPPVASANGYYKELATEKKEMVVKPGEEKSKNNTSDFGKSVPAIQNNNTSLAKRSAEQNNNYQRNQQPYIFRGRVTDADNNGVPFANVTNVQDNNAGTYTDARGNFVLTYPDSVLNVQVRSVGLESTTVQLRNSVASNQVVLQDDRNSLNEVVVSNQKPDSNARNRDAHMKLEQPEPADGWDNYNAYIANNVTVPEDLKDKKALGGEVQVSFEVDKDGEPTRIKIVKSLCDKCDKEAIRLVKEGPKWKRSAKKGRTTVTISF